MSASIGRISRRLRTYNATALLLAGVALGAELGAMPRLATAALAIAVVLVTISLDALRHLATTGDLRR